MQIERFFFFQLQRSFTPSEERLPSPRPTPVQISILVPEEEEEFRKSGMFPLRFRMGSSVRRCTRRMYDFVQRIGEGDSSSSLALQPPSFIYIYFFFIFFLYFSRAMKATQFFRFIVRMKIWRWLMELKTPIGWIGQPHHTGTGHRVPVTFQAQRTEYVDS